MSAEAISASVVPIGEFVDEQQICIDQLLAEFSLTEGVDVARWRDIGLNVGGFLVATVPMNQIAKHDFPMNPEHSSSLAAQMRERAELMGGSGQRDPVDLTTVIGRSGLHITDGFHRHGGLEENGEEYIHAVLTPNITPEKLIDEQIAATRRNEVEMSRVVELAQKAWDMTPWAGKLDVLDAFTMIANRSPGKAYELTAAEREGIAVWMSGKNQIWGLSAKRVLEHLKAAEELDPYVTSLVRSLGDKGDLGFTPAAAVKIQDMFSDTFDGEAIYDQDHVALIAQTANRLKLTLRQTLTLGQMLYDNNNYESAVDLCAGYVPPKESRPSGGTKSGKGSNKGTKVPGSTTRTKSDTTSDSEAVLTLEEQLEAASPQALLTALTKGVASLRRRINIGELSVDPTLRVRLRTIGQSVLDIIGEEPEEKWGVLRKISNGQAHEAMISISNYILTGEGPKPKIPSILDQQTNYIVREVRKKFPAEPDQATRMRIDSFLAELRLRFPQK